MSSGGTSLPADGVLTNPIGVVNVSTAATTHSAISTAEVRDGARTDASSQPGKTPGKRHQLKLTLEPPSKRAKTEDTSHTNGVSHNLASNDNKASSGQRGSTGGDDMLLSSFSGPSKGKGKEPAESGSMDEATPMEIVRPAAATNGFGSAGGAASATRKPAAGQNGATKKLVIKSFKVPPKLPENYEAETWARLKDAIAAVHESRAVASSLEELYKSVENLRSHKCGPRIYDLLHAECANHVMLEKQKLVGGSGDNIAFLNLVDGCGRTIAGR
eukprot:Opistho-2@24546